MNRNPAPRMQRFLLLLAVLLGLLLIMSNGAIFLLPDECSGHVGILPAECIPENLK